MEITYQRNLNKSYMCIETKEDIIEEHELMILQKYKVFSLLPLQVMIQDGKVQYWFEITGKQQLTEYLGGKPIGTELLKKILFSMEQVCQKMPEFLLREDRICLEQELLYIDLSDETIYFTYLPFWNGNFPEEFQRWMEEILKKIDHQNRECIELAYNIYEESRKENVSIRKLLKEGKKSKEPIFEPISEPGMAEVSERKMTELGEVKSWGEELKKKAEKIRKQVLEGKRTLKEKRNRKRQEEFVEKQLAYHTALLHTNTEKPEGKLLYQGEHGCTDIWIGTEEFLLGRNSQQVDGWIETEGISRVHARITQREGDYYIEDLNSTNGTYLNGELLEYHQKRKLSQEDRVRFGVEEYLFY